MDTPSRRMAELIDSLLEQTKRGAISWRQTDLPNSFAYVGKEGSVIVRGPTAHTVEIALGAGDGASLQVLDSRGDRVEEFTSSRGLYSALESLFREVQKRFSEGSPLLDTLRREVEGARQAG